MPPINTHQQSALDGLRHIKSNYTQHVPSRMITVLDATYEIGKMRGWPSDTVITSHDRIGAKAYCSTDTVSRQLKAAKALGLIEYTPGGMGKRRGSKIRLKSKEELKQIKDILPPNPPHIVTASDLCDALDAYRLEWPMVGGESKRGAPCERLYFTTGSGGTDYGGVSTRQNVEADKVNRGVILQDLCKAWETLQYADFKSFGPSLLIPDLVNQGLFSRNLDPFALYDIMAKWLGCERPYAKGVWGSIFAGKHSALNPAKPYGDYQLDSKHVLYELIVAVNIMRQKLFDNKCPDPLQPPQVKTLLGRTCFIKRQSHRGRLAYYRYSGAGFDLINIIAMELIGMRDQGVRLLFINGDAVAVAVNKGSNFDLVDFMDSKSASLGLHARAAFKDTNR
jgi:hypothetical protein